MPRTSFDLSEGYMPGRRNSTTPPDWIVDAATGCWVWQKWCDPTRSGYPKVRAGLAHRVLYEHVYGQQPDDVDVHHKCRNKLCVNPEHMEALPAREHRAKHWLEWSGLTWDQLKELHALGRDPTVTRAEAARRYGMDQENVARLWRGQTWPELGGPSTPETYCEAPGCDEPTAPRRHARFCSEKCRKRVANAKRNRRKVAA